MLELRNDTPFFAKLVPGLDQRGVLHVAVVIKGTFEVRSMTPVLVVAKEQMPLKDKDIFLGETGKTSLRYESDAVWTKPAVDLILNGHAYAPGGKKARVLDTSLEVGSYQYRVRVFGTRYWQKEATGWTPGAPELFDRMALIYENAFGGRVDAPDDSHSASYEANPVGKGYIGEKYHLMEEGVELPNLEFPEHLIQHWKGRPPPAGFGAIARNWQPRLGYAGSYDRRWEEERMPLLPEDFDERFYNSAHPRLILPKGKIEGQRVIATNLSESGRLIFDIPEYRFKIRASVKGKSSELQPLLDTVVIEPDLQRVTLTWRAAIPCGQQFLHLERVAVNWRAA